METCFLVGAQDYQEGTRASLGQVILMPMPNVLGIQSGSRPWLRICFPFLGSQRYWASAQQTWDAISRQTPVKDLLQDCIPRMLGVLPQSFGIQSESRSWLRTCSPIGPRKYWAKHFLKTLGPNQKASPRLGPAFWLDPKVFRGAPE